MRLQITHLRNLLFHLVEGLTILFGAALSLPMALAAGMLYGTRTRANSAANCRQRSFFLLWRTLLARRALSLVVTRRL